MTVLLAIDTAGPRLQLALLRDDAVDTLVEDMPKGQAERIFPAIDELLARNGTTMAHLTRIAVTTGPGSFTGLRIGLAAARGLGLALELPVVGVPTLVAISLSGPRGLFGVLVDARRGEHYFQAFEGPGNPLGPAVVGGVLEIPKIVLRDEPVPIAALARFAATAEPRSFPPDPAYIRDADAKPQEKFRVARQ
jgi:tRNA threonylcarbamoyl adenosine modification protein YeaZ